MMAFDHVFPELAERERRAIQASVRGGEPATFVFRELYCFEPGCDCRRVVVHAIWVERRCVAATINYAFDPPRRRVEPQCFLDPLNPQGEHAAQLLEVFADMVSTDAA